MEQTEIISFIIFGNIILLVFITGIILFFIQYRKRKSAHEQEKAMMSENHAKELLAAQLEIQQQTMQHIGREIHDNVGQKLTLASLYAQQLSFENKAPHINDKIVNIGAIINESLSELRQLSKSLTDDFIAQSNITELVERECQAVNRLQKVKVVFTTNSNSIQLNYQQKNILLRVVQEFLQNSMKHADCRNIRIDTATGEGVLVVSLSDDGKGFSLHQQPSQGIGLNNIKKRIQLLGGSFKLDSGEGTGTHLQISIPY